MPSPSRDTSTECERSEVVILGTGGTIAGRAGSSIDNVGYTAGAAAVEELIAAVPSLAGQRLGCERVAQMDSKDIDVPTWVALAQRCRHHLSRDEVAGVVVTHGTDTLEETAWFLHRVLAPTKPLVLAAAMRPATSLQADGPQNLFDAVGVARAPGARGVLVAFAGRVHGAAAVQKMHPYRIDAFDSPDEGALALLEEGRLRQLREWPRGDALPGAVWDVPPEDWPWVALVTSHAGADARLVPALVECGVAGIVVAGSGNATIHRALEGALRDAARAGVAVRRTSRCAMGAPVGAVAPHAPTDGDGSSSGECVPFPFYPGLNPVKARIELQLELLRARAERVTPPSA